MKSIVCGVFLRITLHFHCFGAKAQLVIICYEVRHKPLKTILLACIIEAQCSAGMKEHIQKDIKKVQSKNSHTMKPDRVYGDI